MERVGGEPLLRVRGVEAGGGGVHLALGALTKDYTRPLVYSSVVLSLLPGVGLGIYMIIKGRSVDQCNASSWVQVLS
jgi:hypothetical protein